MPPKNITIGFPMYRKRPEPFSTPRTSPNDPVLVETSWTKIGRIKSLTHFSTIMSDIHLESGNIETKSIKTYVMEYD